MKKYWKSIDEYHDPEVVKEETIEAAKEHKESLMEILDDDFNKKSASRRDFLKLFGFSFATAALYSSCERPVTKAIPYLIKPEEITPGKANHYASSYFDGNDFAGVLVKVRDGRPIKIEGNPAVSVNGKGTSAKIQASILNLYDDARYKSALKKGRKITWDSVDEEIVSQLNEIKNKGGNIRLLTSTIISPSTKEIIENFCNEFNAKWTSYDAISYSALKAANKEVFGQDYLPSYDFSKADLIVSFGADFLGTWLSPVEFASQYAQGRDLNPDSPKLSRLIQLESEMSLTGSNADERIPLVPSQIPVALAELYNEIANAKSASRIKASNSGVDVKSIANELLAAEGKSLVVCGVNNKDCQVLVSKINHLLTNTGNTFLPTKACFLKQGNDEEVQELFEELKAGKVDALFTYNVNPHYDFYDANAWDEAVKNVKLNVSFAVAKDETAEAAQYILPDHHYLESWNDAIPYEGLYALSQPTIHPIFETRAFAESLMKWTGNKYSYYDYIRSYYKEFIFKNESLVWTEAWNENLQKGIVEIPIQNKKVDFTDVEVQSDLFTTSPNSNEFVLYQNIGIADGKSANNPWLQELPDAISKVTWDNYLAISLAYAKANDLETGDYVKINGVLDIPVVVQPGQKDGSFALALGYGRTKAGKVAEGVGENAYPFVSLYNGHKLYQGAFKSVEKTGDHIDMALTQTHHSMEGRKIVREATLDEYKKQHNAGNEFHEEIEKKHLTLYKDPEFDGFHWGLAIDLNKCIGCNNCVTSCQVENNVAVVGRDQVKKRRIMHWIKMDRYYSDNPENPEVYHQPIMCQHCDQAPCENVCPVSATMHSNEGLNQISYNRCIGTKYCMNNCPYKVRRFNWFRYINNPEFDFNQNSDLSKLVLNPDVTVRERGVVEKCTFCVQRIQEKKLQAKLENRELMDGEIQPACVQSCPTDALVFGNLNDKKSKVSEQFANERNYHLLEELHTLPSVGFLTKIKNKKA